MWRVRLFFIPNNTEVKNNTPRGKQQTFFIVALLRDVLV